MHVTWRFYIERMRRDIAALLEHQDRAGGPQLLALTRAQQYPEAATLMQVLQTAQDPLR